MYKTIIDSGSHCQALGSYETQEEAEIAGQQWLEEMFFIDPGSFCSVCRMSYPVPTPKGCDCPDDGYSYSVEWEDDDGGEADDEDMFLDPIGHGLLGSDGRP